MIYKYTIKYIVAIIILNKLLSFRSININKNKKIIRGIFSDLHQENLVRLLERKPTEVLLGSYVTGFPWRGFFFLLINLFYLEDNYFTVL